MGNNKLSVSVVIPNYNGKKLLEKNLPSISEAIRTAEVKDYEIIIPDDNSSDTSVKFVRNNYPGVVLIENTQNQGFSKNINQGIQIASKDLTLILNTDMELDRDYLVHCLPYFQHEDTFGVMGDVNGNHFKLYKQSFIGIVPFERKGLITPEHSNMPFLLMSGGHSLLDTMKLQLLGGFDEGFSPFYGEDDDLGLRAWRRGWRYYFEGKAKCEHATSSTISSSHRQKYINIIAKRNKLYLNFIHLNTTRLAVYLFIQILKLLTYWILLKFYYYKVFSAFSKLFSRALKRRREVQKQSKYSLEYVVTNVLREQKDYLNLN